LVVLKGFIKTTVLILLSNKW